MNVRELKDIIEHLPDGLEVILARDAEGNSFSPLCDASIQRYMENTEWSGDLVMSEDGLMYTEEDEYDFANDVDNVFDVVCLWPTY